MRNLPIEMIPPTELGVLFLGLFVGAVLGLGLAHSRPTLKVALTVIGTALGGAPVLFLDLAGNARWVYPVGLVLGPGLVRAWFARATLEDPRSSTIEKVFAFLDVIVICCATVGATVYALIPESEARKALANHGLQPQAVVWWFRDDTSPPPRLRHGVRPIDQLEFGKCRHLTGLSGAP